MTNPIEGYHQPKINKEIEQKLLNAPN